MNLRRVLELLLTCAMQYAKPANYSRAENANQILKSKYLQIPRCHAQKAVPDEVAVGIFKTCSQRINLQNRFLKLPGEGAVWEHATLMVSAAPTTRSSPCYLQVPTPQCVATLTHRLAGHWSAF
jgi:hypothetical protein